MTDDIHSRQPERFKRFFIQGESHTVLELPQFYTTTIDGTTVRDWTADLLDDGPQWQDLVEGFADLSEEISGGNGPVHRRRDRRRDLDEAGYVEHEYVAAGTAASYAATEPLTGDGRWTFAPDGSAPYRTRVLVRYPADPAAVQRHGRRRVAQRQRRRRRQSRLRQPRRRVDAPGARLGRRLGAAHRRRGRPGARRGARRRGSRGQGTEGDRPGALRIAQPPRRRLLVRHLHPGGARAAPGRIGARRRCGRSMCSPPASRSRRSPS